jgi:ABC-type nitrate/sulfonate/bicarbonate transport system substrate-binding protein
VGGVFIPHVLAQERGFFREEGLDVEIPIMRSNLVAAGVTSGEVDYEGSFTPAVSNALAGVPERVVAATVNKSTRRVMAVPEINSMAALRGRTVVIAALAGGVYNSGLLAFEHFGIDPHREITWLAAGGLTERYLALQQGAAQASIFSGPEIPRAEAMGLVTLVHLNDVAPLPESGLAANLTKLETQRNQVKRMLRALIRAQQFVRANRDESLPTFMSFLRVTREEAAQAYDGIAFAFSDDGTLSDRSMRYTLDAERKQHGLPEDVLLSRVADFGPLYEVLAELGISPAPDSAH